MIINIKSIDLKNNYTTYKKKITISHQMTKKQQKSYKIKKTFFFYFYYSFITVS